MHRHFKIPGLGLAALTATAFPAYAQEGRAPTPTPTPSAIPGVIPERFSIGPAVTPTPVVVPTPTASATPRAVATPAAQRPVPRPSATAAAGPVRDTAPAALATPAPTALASPTPAAIVPAATPSPALVAAPQPQPQPARTGLPGWLWALGGAGAMALAFGAYRLLRTRDELPDAADAEPAPLAAPPPPRPEPVAAPVLAAPVPAPPSEPFDLVLRPQRIHIGEREVVLEVELLIGNLQGQPAENIRAQIAPMSANPDQDRHAAGFHAAAMIDSDIPAFDLPAGGGGRMPVRLTLPREQLHIVQVGNRAMFVPMVLIDLRWRAGISIRRFGADFMLGTAGQSGKLGPIWLDRQPSGALAATRYAPRASAAAA